MKNTRQRSEEFPECSHQDVLPSFTIRLLNKESKLGYKLVLVVREDLNMGPGKIASQCSHASLIAYQTSLLSNSEAVKIWDAFGQAKVVLKTNDESSLLKLHVEAKKLGLNSNIVSDAGKTQVAPGTKTVLAVGPGQIDIVNKVTGHLKLL